jgi:hypothetical protein
LLQTQVFSKPVEHAQPVGQCHAGEDESSSPLMVVWKDVEVPLPLDEQHRWDQLVGYNILDTVGCNQVVSAVLQSKAWRS